MLKRHVLLIITLLTLISCIRNKSYEQHSVKKETVKVEAVKPLHNTSKLKTSKIRGRQMGKTA